MSINSWIDNFFQDVDDVFRRRPDILPIIKQVLHDTTDLSLPLHFELNQIVDF